MRLEFLSEERLQRKIKRKKEKQRKQMIRQNLRFYAKNLSNYRSVVKETNNQILINPQGYYNCMGYALGTFDWEDIDSFRYTPYRCGEKRYLECMNEILWECVDELLERFPQIRLIKSPREKEIKERIIAFRLSETDFHWARLGADGIWTHKPGSSPIRIMSEEEFCGEWCPQRVDPYISDVVFFAVSDD